MKQTILLDTATTPDGRPMTLLSHDRDRMIRVAGIELMSTRQHHSEECLGELACRHLIGHRGSRVLVGGLGMGFTLRAVLGTLPSDAEVVVAEIMPAVIKWNRDPALGLGADCLVDPRVGLTDAQADKVVAALGVSGADTASARTQIKALYETFVACDCFSKEKRIRSSPNCGRRCRPLPKS